MAQADAVALGVALDVLADRDRTRPRRPGTAPRAGPARPDRGGRCARPCLRLLVEQMHVGDERIGLACSLASALLSAQKAAGSVPILGRKAYSCIGLGRERAVEIVDQRDGLLVELGRPCARLSAPALAPASSLSLRRPLAALHGVTIDRFGGGKKAVGNGQLAVGGRACGYLLPIAHCLPPIASFQRNRLWGGRRWPLPGVGARVSLWRKLMRPLSRS